MSIIIRHAEAGKCIARALIAAQPGPMKTDRSADSGVMRRTWPALAVVRQRRCEVTN